MYSIKSKVETSTGIKQAFDLAQNYSIRGEWDPFIKEYKYLTPDLPLGNGFQVWVLSKQRMSMTVEYVNFQIPTQVAMKMISTSRYFTKFSGYWHFEENGEGTEITFSYKFEPKLLFRPVGLLIKWVLRYEMKTRLKALKKYLEIETEIL